MAKKYEFKPDKPNAGLLSKLYLTQKQRKSLLKWTIYGLLLVFLSVLQDVLLCRISIFGATTELVPCGICLQTMQEFCTEDFLVIGETEQYSLKELLPKTFQLGE